MNQMNQLASPSPSHSILRDNLIASIGLTHSLNPGWPYLDCNRDSIKGISSYLQSLYIKDDLQWLGSYPQANPHLASFCVCGELMEDRNAYQFLLWHCPKCAGNMAYFRSILEHFRWDLLHANELLTTEIRIESLERLLLEWLNIDFYTKWAYNAS